ncbi:MAG: ABC transporter permease [Bacillota bacterium]
MGHICRAIKGPLVVAGAHLRVQFLTLSTYRIALLSQIVEPVVKAFILSFLLRAIYSSAPDKVLPVPITSAISYVALAAFLGVFVGFNNAASMAERVISGDVVFDLLRPWSWFGLRLGEYIGTRLPSVLWPFLAFIGLTLSIGAGLVWSQYLVLLLLLPGVFILEFGLSFNIGTATLWTQNSWGLGLSFAWLQQLFTGLLVPLILLPDSLSRFAYLTPFPYLVDGPIRVILGLEDAASILFGQISWSLGLMILGSFLHLAAMRKLRVNGG